MNHTSIPAPATDSSGQRTLARSLGRRAALDEAFATLAAGSDVLIEVEHGMGATAITAAAIDRAAAHGFVPVAPGHLPRIATPRHVIIADVTKPTSELLDALRADHASVSLGMVLVCRPYAPFTTPEPGFVSAVRSAAHTITLRPTTRDEVDQIASELLQAGSIPTLPSAVECQWAWTTGSGFARLIESLLQDLGEAPEVEGALTRFSRRTIVVASEIVSALPPQLRRLACRLLPLVGVRMSRLVRVLDRVELGLLAESHIISESDGTLCISAPLQTALRLVSDLEETDDVVLSVILDVCAAIDVDADYREDELGVVIAELGHNATLRRLVPEATQRTVYTRAMSLARRRGDNEDAAALARRALTLGSADDLDPALRSIARADDDDLTAVARLVAALPQLPPPDETTVWLGCLQIPALGAPPGALDVIDAVLERFMLGPQRSHIQGLRDSVAAARLLDRGDLAGALISARRLLATPSSGLTAQLRALAVASAVHTESLDGEALSRLVIAHIGLLASETAAESLVGDLDRRQALDTMLLLALMFAALGVDQPEEFVRLVDEMLTSAVRRGRADMVTQLTVCILVQAHVAGDAVAVSGTLRMLRRKRHTDLSPWIIGQFEGRATPPPPRIGSGRFFLGDIASARVVCDEARTDVPAFSAALIARTPAFDRLQRLAEAASTVLQDMHAGAAAQASIADLVDIPLVAGTVPAALRDVVLGAGRDAALVQRAAAALLGRAAVPLAVAVLDLAVPLVAGDRAAERELHRLQRDARSRRHPGVAAPSGLTPREREIAVLAASGMSNRDIARALFLSVRTVESHLYRAMRKSAVTREGLWVIQQDQGDAVALP